MSLLWYVLYNLFKLGDDGIWAEDKPGIWTIFEAFTVLLGVILYFTIPFVFEKHFFVCYQITYFPLIET